MSTLEGVPVDPRDRVRSETTSPGSIAKMATATLALEQGLHLTRPVLRSYTSPDGRTIWAMGKQACGGTLSAAMAASCNPYFAALGVELGPETLNSGARKWLNGQSQIEGMPIATSSFTSPDADAWHTAAGAIGQGDAQTTPLAFAALTSQIARGGDPVCLHLVITASESAGCTHLASMAEPAAQQVARAMRYTATNGTASSVPGLGSVEAAAKTGTADTDGEVTNATFAAFAPESEPRVAVVVFIEPGPHRRQGLSGAKDAGPVASTVLMAALRTR